MGVDNWPPEAQDAAERLLKRAVEFVEDGLGRLDEAWWGEKGVRLDAWSAEVREWAGRRLTERIRQRTQ